MKRLHWASVALAALLSGRAALGQTQPPPLGGPPESSVGLAEGDRYWDESDFVRAHATFEREYRQTGLLTAGLKSARALVRLGRLLEAAARYEELISADRPNGGGGDPASVRQDAAVDLQQLLSRIPRIIISIVGAPSDSVAIALNGVRVPSPPPSAGVPVNPGRYLITGILRGRTVEQYVDGGEGDVESVQLRFGPPGFGGDATSLNTSTKGAAGPLGRTRGPGGQRLVGVVTLGVGAAALVTGGFIGWSALKDEESLERRCPDRRCPQKLDSEVDSYEAKKLIALVGVGAGGLLLAGGAILTFTAPSPRSEPRVGAFVTPNGAGLWGKF